jgi:uncharacterized membrane protein
MTEQRHTGWELPALCAIAIAGLVISIYLTATHANAVPLVCTTGSVVNCSSVTHSAYSVIPGTSIPISVPGMAWFLTSAALAAIAWLRARSGRADPSWLRPLHLALASLALLAVLYLVYVEIVILHQICEWCTVVHLLVLASFVLALRRVQQAGPPIRGDMKVR